MKYVALNKSDVLSNKSLEIISYEVMCTVFQLVNWDYIYEVVINRFVFKTLFQKINLSERLPDHIPISFTIWQQTTHLITFSNLSSAQLIKNDFNELEANRNSRKLSC